MDFKEECIALQQFAVNKSGVSPSERLRLMARCLDIANELDSNADVEIPEDLLSVLDNEGRKVVVASFVGIISLSLQD